MPQRQRGVPDNPTDTRMNPPNTRKESLVRKLYNREVYGQFIRGVSLNHEPAKQLFPRVPPRLIFDLWETLPNIRNHILMGATRCGQLLLTYTYTLDPSSVFSPSTHYRYRLHFWAFRPGKPAAKVAEVQLFDGCDIQEVLTIGIVQWPNINDRLLIFGNCPLLENPEGVDSWELESESKSTTFITVTTIPSLAGCADCRAVAASFDEEEMAANWDSGVGLTCLKHGLTIHTWFSVPNSYVFDPQVCASVDNQVVINTGSFVHVLNFGLEKTPIAAPAPPRSKPNIVTVPINNRLNYKFLRHNGYNVFLSDTWASNMTQILVDVVIQQGLQVDVRELPIFLKMALQKQLQMNCRLIKQAGYILNSDSVINILTDIKRPGQKWFSTTKNLRITDVTTVNKPKPGKRPMDDADKVYDFKESDDRCEPKFKLYRRRCLADKMYEFRSDEDSDMENIRPKSQLLHDQKQEVQHKKSITTSSASQQQSPNKEEPSKTDSVCRRQCQRIFFRCHVDPTEKIPIQKFSVLYSDSETEEEHTHQQQQVASPPSESGGTGGDTSEEPSMVVRAIIADWESSEQEWAATTTPQAELTPAERRERNVANFLSGLVDTGSGCCGGAGPRRMRSYCSSTRAALKPSNRNGGPTLRNTRLNKPINKPDTLELTDSMRKEMERGFGHQPVTSCSVRFTRRFIESDQEITSTITDIDDDEIGPGFPCALPLSVHGSAYSQMEMISNQKAEKLNVLCAVVTQSTLDIEHFCYKAAETICRLQGYKFWFCSDYDTEIISVCPLTEDILFVVFIRLNAEDKKLSNNENPTHHSPRKLDMRDFYECSCLCTWSAAKAKCYLEGYTGLKAVLTDTPKPWLPASKEAKSLREKAPHHFGIVHQRPVRSFVHYLKDGQLGESWKISENRLTYGINSSKVLHLRDSDSDMRTFEKCIALVHYIFLYF